MLVVLVEFCSFIDQAPNQNLQQAHKSDETHIIYNSNDNDITNRH